MGTMQDYTIYCTEEQTRRAYKLGAPLIKSGYYTDVISCKAIDTNEQYYPIIPTTQQMVGWLLESSSLFDIRIYKSADYTYSYQVFLSYGWNSILKNRFSTRHQAELAAIDAALDCLEKNL